MALRGNKCIDLMNDVMKVLGIYFSCNKTLEQEKKFLNHIVNILKLCKLRNLTIEGRIVVFKPLATSRLLHFALDTYIINLLTKMQMEFIWKEGNPKMRNSTLCNDYENNRQKNIDIFCKL